MRIIEARSPVLYITGNVQRARVLNWIKKINPAEH